MKYFIGIISIVIFLFSCQNKEKTKLPEDSNIEQLSQKIKADTNNDDLYYQRAKLYFSEKKTENALKDINKAISLNPDKAQYYIIFSDINFALGKVRDTEDALNKALKAEPENNEALLKMAELNFFFKKYPQTAEYLNKSLKINSINPKAYFIRGMTYKETGDTANAIADFSKSVEQNPQYFDAYMQLGLIYSVKKNQIALDYFNNALNIQPNSIEALYAKAMLLQETLKIEEAEQVYNSILQINPEYKYAYYNLGYINLVYLKEYQKATDFFSKAINIDADYYEAYYNRGYSYELMGNMLKAKEDYKKAQEINPDYKKAKNKLQTLEGK